MKASASQDLNPPEQMKPVLCRFSDAGNDEAGPRRGGRRRKTAERLPRSSISLSPQSIIAQRFSALALSRRSAMQSAVHGIGQPIEIASQAVKPLLEGLRSSSLRLSDEPQQASGDKTVPVGLACPLAGP